MSVSTFWGFFTAVVLAIWTVPDGLKWFAFEMFRAYVPYGPISMAWAKYVSALPLHVPFCRMLLILTSQRNLLRRRRRARHRAGHHERFRLRRQRLASLPRLSRCRRSGVPQGFHLLECHVCGAGGDYLVGLVHASEGGEEEGDACRLSVRTDERRRVGRCSRSSRTCCLLSARLARSAAAAWLDRYLCLDCTSTPATRRPLRSQIVAMLSEKRVLQCAALLSMSKELTYTMSVCGRDLRHGDSTPSVQPSTRIGHELLPRIASHHPA